MQSFTGLKVWTKAHALTLHVYRASRTFPIEERFGLTGQMRRSSASIGANIARDAVAVVAQSLDDFFRLPSGRRVNSNTSCYLRGT